MHTRCFVKDLVANSQPEVCLLLLQHDRFYCINLGCPTHQYSYLRRRSVHDISTHLTGTQEVYSWKGEGRPVDGSCGFGVGGGVLILGDCRCRKDRHVSFVLRHASSKVPQSFDQHSLRLCIPFYHLHFVRKGAEADNERSPSSRTPVSAHALLFYRGGSGTSG